MIPGSVFTRRRRLQSSYAARKQGNSAIGNISDTPPEGNWPRRPLCIAEVDEETTALVIASVRVVDDYEPGADASERVQFSNFSLIENRETGDLEMYLTRYGEFGEIGTPRYYESDVFRYVLSFKQ